MQVFFIRPQFISTILFLFISSSSYSNIYNVFVVTGELSGDKLGAWYINKLKNKKENIYVEAIGGPFLQKSGAMILQEFNELSIGFSGITNVIRKIPTIYQTFKLLASHISKNKFDEIVLVDFPLINLPLSWYLKKNYPNITITYIAPPELWTYRYLLIDKILKHYCDHIIILYPFEVAWYKQHCKLNVEWHGCPFIERYNNLEQIEKTKTIAIAPGSLISEIKIMLPIFANIIKRFKEKYSDIHFVIPRAKNISERHFCKLFDEYGIDNNDIEILEGNVLVFLEKNGIDDCFDFIYSANNLFGKHRTINATLKQFNISPHEVVYIGDEMRDVDAARNSNIKIAAVCWGYNSKSALQKTQPDIIIEHPKELFDALHRL
jgi:hypothetical protein